MLSVILYGRNDSHGYNLHKRGAISLNCIAEVMTGPDDEILFVDYNTPDELPTFPEAIADTLTDQCKAKLRILRVRPDYHAQFAHRTRLVALECQSRNIAIRRSNPNNRWILSTNTDMIFHPRSADSLGGVVGQLEDGFYHLPRFEVPEGFWERLDRLDPKAAIDAMVEAGTRFHLNEIVYGSYDNIYEGPGDFQLFLRQDLFDICGFDESMILGWHADSNMARRMKLLRGDVKTAFDNAYGYHCGHTRQATSLHGGTRTENNSEVFVRDVSDPVARHQADTWGAPGWNIEEVRLDRPETFLPAMAAAVVAEGPEYSEATYNASSVGKVTYDAEHVLPHLCDTLFNLPAGQKIFYFGADIPLLEGVRSFLETAGKAPEFLLTNLGDCPRIADLEPARWGSGLRTLQEALAEASLVLMAYPGADLEPADRRIAAEWWCQRVFTLLAGVERDKPMAQRRRVIVVNAIQTGVTHLVTSNLSPTVTPFSSRLRQGWIVQDAIPGGGANPVDAVYSRLARGHVFSPQDLTLIEKVVRDADHPPPGWERFAPEIASICAGPPSAAERFGMRGDQVDAWAEMADGAMRLQIGRLVQTPEALPPRIDVGNRLCSGADWDDPEWARLAVSYFSPDVLSFHERKRWIWERVSLARQIGQVLPVPEPDLEGRFTAPRILVMSDWPEFLAAMLTHLGYEVAYATPADYLAGRASGDWHPGLDLTSVLLPTPLTPLDPADDRPFDGFAITVPSLFEKSRAEVDEILAAVHPRLKPGAVFFASGTAQLNEIAYEGGFSFAEWKVLYEPQGPLGARGFEPVGGFDDRVPMDTAVRFAFNDDPEETLPGLSYGFLKGFNTSALITARWPAALKPGPEGRLEWPQGPLVNPYQVAIPYGRTPTRPAPPEYYAEAARFDLAAHAMRAFTDAEPVAVDAMARNVAPFAAVFSGEARRSPTALEVVEDGGGRISLCLEAGEARQVRVAVEGDGPLAIAAVQAVVQGWGLVEARIEDGEAVVERDHPLTRVTLALLVSPSPSRIRRIMARTAAPAPVAG